MAGVPQDPGGPARRDGYPPAGQGLPPAGQGSAPPGYRQPGDGFPPPGQGYPPPGQGYLPPGQGYPPPGLAPRPGGWTAGRIVSAVIGVVIVLCSLGLLAGGGAALWADTTQRDAAGYVNLGTADYSTSGYALASEAIAINSGSGWDAASSLFGTARIRVTQTSGAGPVFAGIASPSAAGSYLSGVQYATFRGTGRGHISYTEHNGTAPKTPPADAGIWAAKASGTGTQTLTWPVRNGNWTVVAMNADATRPVAVRANVAATMPALPWLATGLLISGAIFLVAGIILIVIPARRASYVR